MTKIRELTEEWEKWVESRPPVVQELCRKFPPDRLYVLKTSKHLVELYSYSENGTMTVLVLEKWNPTIHFERRVFGIRPKDLKEAK